MKVRISLFWDDGTEIYRLEGDALFPIRWRPAPEQYAIEGDRTLQGFEYKPKVRNVPGVKR